MRITIDRIEGDRAVLELSGFPDDAGRRELLEVPLAALPDGASEGLVLTFQLGPAPTGDLAEAEARLARLKARTPQGPGTFDL
ncbi:MAG: DUF3006 domain-containing protein [Myxococcales bacterium]|nr:DUF3006 domain-containing protein [Myxococcales bacterium]